MIQLEKYRGTKSRHVCPACSHKNEFARFVDDAGNYIANDVGICNRASKCGYRYTAKQFFADNPTASKFHSTTAKHTNAGANRARQTYTFVENKTQNPQFDFIAPEHLKATLGNYDRNNFVQFLFDLFPDCSEEIQAVLKMYLVGTYQDGLTVFWQIDGRGRIRTGKIMRYDAQNGHRQIVRTWTDKDGEKHELKVDWMHGKIKKDFNLTQIFFGEHLLPKFPNKPVAIVESEKTAILGSLCFPEFIWLSIGSKQSLKTERLQRLDNRQIILYPDADGFDRWQTVATDAQRQGLSVKASDLIERQATSEQKASGFDLADFLINEQTEINQTNDFIDRYNAKLEIISSDALAAFDDETRSQGVH